MQLQNMYDYVAAQPGSIATTQFKYATLQLCRHVVLRHRKRATVPRCSHALHASSDDDDDDDDDDDEHHCSIDT
eukprot:9007127-Lingulodinium_polyedra.AAC.1